MYVQINYTHNGEEKFEIVETTIPDGATITGAGEAIPDDTIGPGGLPTENDG